MRAVGAGLCALLIVGALFNASKVSALGFLVLCGVFLWLVWPYLTGFYRNLRGELNRQ